MDVEKLVSAVADDLLVNRVYNGIILRTSNALHSIRLVKTLASMLQDGHYRLDTQLDHSTVPLRHSRPIRLPEPRSGNIED